MARLSAWLPAAMCVALVLLLGLASASAQGTGSARQLMGSKNGGWSKGNGHMPDKKHPQEPPKNDHPEVPPKNPHPSEHYPGKNPGGWHKVEMPKIHLPDIKIPYHGGKGDWHVPDYKPDSDWNKGHEPEHAPSHMGGNKGKWH